MSFRPEDISYVDIFPPIGIARAGDSAEWYLGSEIPGVEHIPNSKFKDAEHKIKRRGVLFRLYAFGKNGEVLGEIDGKDGYTIEWKVHVANKKSAWVNFRGQYRNETWTLRNPDVQGWPDDKRDYAYTDTRDKLIIDSGEQTLRGLSQEWIPLQGDFYGSKSTPTKVHLGDIRTDGCGRLIVLAGDGHSYSLDHVNDPPLKQPSLNDMFNNSDWVDSMCDGTVYVTVSSKTLSCMPIPVHNKSTIIMAPPKFTSGLQCSTSLLELIEDVYERQKRDLPGYDVGQVNFYRDIEPLFRRLYLNSWTNFRANEGHGPRKADLFLSNPDLSNPTTTNTMVREDIFKRIRAPVKKGDAENQALRDTQANMYYMPRLGGDDGDMPENSSDPNNRDRWASLTQLQYDRLAKWSRGDFITGEPIVRYLSFDEIPVHEQPSALTTSALEWSVGAPLYPGIEVYWQAEFDEMYKLGTPFRFADSVRVGDLGKGLSLPWQADFFMCNTHWWPSVRPDNIVTESDFLSTWKKFKDDPSHLAINITKRTRWDDGLDRGENPDEDELPGNSEMVRKWMKLGFVTSQPYGRTTEHTLPIYVEKERHPDLPHSDDSGKSGE